MVRGNKCRRGAAQLDGHPLKSQQKISLLTLSSRIGDSVAYSFLLAPMDRPSSVISGKRVVAEGRK